MESDVDATKGPVAISEHYGRCGTCSKAGWIKVFKDWSFHEICGHIDDWGKTVDLDRVKRTPISRSAIGPTISVKQSGKTILPDMKSKAKSTGSSPPSKDISLRKSIHLKTYQSPTVSPTISPVLSPTRSPEPKPDVVIADAVMPDNEMIIAYKKLLEENKLLKQQMEKNSAETIPTIPAETIIITPETSTTTSAIICSSAYDCSEVATISNSEGFWFCAKHFELLLPARKHCNLFDACDNSDFIEVRPGLFGCSIHRSQYGFI